MADQAKDADDQAMDANMKLSLSAMIGKPCQYDLQPRREKPFTIYKVRESYAPQIVSIGPFHHGNEELLHMEWYKRQFTRDLIGRHPSNSLPNYIKALSSASSVVEASGCYSEIVIDSDTVSTFVELMVIDGCFLIEFFVKSILGEDMGELDFVHGSRSLVENDLLLLENQIPFSVLESLFASTVIPGITDTQCPANLKELAFSYISRDRQNAQPIPEVVHHLLHLHHFTLAPTPRVAPPLITLHSRFPKLLNRVRHGSPELGHREWRMMPRATEIYKSGVTFQINKLSGSLLDIDFNFEQGIMEIPRLSVQPVTVSQFRNLVAFEQYYPAAGNYFTAYVRFMCSLIDGPEDVRLLKKSGVLESDLSDHDVWHFFNSFSKGAYLNCERHYLVDLLKDVNEYCEIEGR